jgi:DNA-binding CsgD family transcriptional regulator
MRREYHSTWIWYYVIMDIQYKVDINPSYEWAKEAEGLAISHRELEVLALVVEGYKNKEIAQILKIQHQSVKNHLQHLLRKLNVKNNTQAYIMALHLNLIKVRMGIVGGKGRYGPREVTGQDVVEYLRKVISGEYWGTELSDKKTRQWLKVWLKEHGIEPYEWGEDK